MQNDRRNRPSTDAVEALLVMLRDDQQRQTERQRAILDGLEQMAAEQQALCDELRDLCRRLSHPSARRCT